MKKRKVSNAEFSVLNLLWNAGDALSVAQVVQLMESEKDTCWAYSTAATILRRMEKKGYVYSEKKGASLFYTAVMQVDDFQQIEEERQQTEARKAASIIDKCFQGSFSKFLSAFSSDKKLTKEEFEDLKEWVRQHDDDY